MTNNNPFSAWIPMATFHSWITALFYPAVLGTALMAWLSPENAVARENTHWAPVLIAYFALQYGDGIGRGRSYDVRGLLADVLEMLAILAAFDLMNILDVGLPRLAPGVEFRWVLAAVFLIPVLNRFSRMFVPGPSRDAEGPARPWALTIMSGLAAGLAFLNPESPDAAKAVGVILAFYFLFFIPPRSDTIHPFWNWFRRDAPPPR